MLLDAANELLRPPVPTMLRGVLRGGLMLAGMEIFRAGLYVGLGSLGNEAASWVLRETFGGGGGSVEGGGISRGPMGRDEW